MSSSSQIIPDLLPAPAEPLSVPRALNTRAVKADTNRPLRSWPACFACFCVHDPAGDCFDDAAERQAQANAAVDLHVLTGDWNVRSLRAICETFSVHPGPLLDRAGKIRRRQAESRLGTVAA